MIRVPALRIVQSGLSDEGKPIELYVTAMTLGQLRGLTQVDVWSPVNKKGYQRPQKERRLKELSGYITKGKGVFPTSILLGIRPDSTSSIKLEGFTQGDQGISQGTLEFPAGDEKMLWIIDGQHRFNGVKWTYDNGAGDLEYYPFPIAIIWGVDQYEEMLHFNIINTEQRKMDTDIVDRHLTQKLDEMGPEAMQRSGSRGERDYRVAVTTKVVDVLNEDGVWKDNISIPGVEGRNNGLVRQHALVSSLEPFMKDNYVRDQLSTVELKAQVVNNFWQAVKQTWEEAFADPSSYRIQATVGIYSLHILLPALMHRCLEDQDLTVVKMQELLESLNIGSTFWHKEEGDPFTLGTGMASIRALARYLIAELREPQYTKLRL